MPYYLDNQFLLDNPWITVVGTGGTGGFVAEASAASSRAATPPSFWWTTTGWNPTTCSARISTQATWGNSRARPWPTGWPGPTTGPWATRSIPSARRARPQGSRYPGLSSHDGLVIGCADNAAARRAMAECLPGDPCRWVIDAGNDTNWGQVLIGNVAEPVVLEEPPFTGDTCHLAPAPTLQRPDLLTAVSTRPPDVDCAAALDLTDQDPTINQMMASLVLQVVRRMVAGTCPFMGLYLDMDLGLSTPATSPRRRWRGWWGGTTPGERRKPRHAENNKELSNHD